MKHLYYFFPIFLLTGWIVDAKEYDLYYLGGQSNMDGYGYVSELPSELNQPVEGVMIFHGNTLPDGGEVGGKGIWATLQPGHGVGIQSDGKSNKYSDRFGVEITFAKKLKEMRPNRNIAIIKYSRGGTSIAMDASAASRFGCWDADFDGVNQYDHFLATVRYALSHPDIDGDGEADTLNPAGILWMQGESDANEEEVAKRYEANLKRLMDLIRAALREDDLPVVIGRISDSGIEEDDGKVWDYGKIVRQAQADFVTKDAAAALVTSTDGYSYSDKWHYDTAGYIDFGKQFAEKMNALLSK